MRTQEIPKAEWHGFFDSFSRKHQGWLVKLEIFGPDIGAQVEEEEIALEGITDESDETQGNRIMIMTGVRPEDHVTHLIAYPTQVSLEQQTKERMPHWRSSQEMGLPL